MLSRLRPSVHVIDETKYVHESTGAEMVSTWGGVARKGRAWFRWDRTPSEKINRHERVVALEWLTLTASNATGVSLTTDSDDYEWSVHVGVDRLFHLFVSLGGFLPGGPTTREPPYEGRELALSIHDGQIWWSLWNDPISWSAKTPRWRHGNFNFVDWLLGKVVYAKETLEVHDDVPVPMPEGQYLAKITLERCTWKRAHTILGIGERTGLYFEVEFDPSLDGTSSMSTPARTGDLWEAVAHAVEVALRNRNRRSSRGDRLLPRP